MRVVCSVRILLLVCAFHADIHPKLHIGYGQSVWSGGQEGPPDPRTQDRRQGELLGTGCAPNTHPRCMHLCV